MTLVKYSISSVVYDQCHNDQVLQCSCWVSTCADPDCGDSLLL